MKVSENWLREWVEIPADRAGLMRRLTASGLEVAGAEVVGGELAGVIVARIVTCDAHPNADKLHICKVDTGAGEVQIVCGAPNARAGLVAPLAMLGAKLPGGITIKAAKLRGVESSGMLCSARELGVDADASGLMELPADAPVGTPLAEYLGLPDAAIEIELTPNRGDCLGLLGLADEVAAEFGTRAKPFAAATVAPTVAAPRGIRLEAGADCPRYLGRSVRGVDVRAATPVWMLQRLRAAGVKPISVAVDVTNYVMLETGQPMHAFDAARLDGDIVVRRARAGESLKLLDGGEAKLDAGFLVVADAAKPLAVAGVMGGFDSRVTDATQEVFLEAAHFAPSVIMGKARKLGLATDAAHRFERGVDPELPRLAIERATGLLWQIAGGQVGEVIEASLPEHLRAPAAITLRQARIARVLGVEVPAATVERILAGLGMRVEPVADGWRVTAPSRRFDIEREEDLIEEVARIHGYDAIPARLPAGAPPAPHSDESSLSVDALRDALAARGFQEAVCYAFVDPRWLRDWQLEADTVVLANPLSAELAVMRPSLLPGLVDALARNRRRQQGRVRLFESGVVFKGVPGAAPEETTMIAGVASGSAAPEQWGRARRALDFFDIKGDLQSMLRLAAGATWAFDARDLPAWLHPGRSARVLRDGEPVGWVGALHPGLQAGLDVPDVYVFEVRQTALARRVLPHAHELPKFPSLRRDIAIEVDESVAWGDVAAALRARLPAELAGLTLFDCFRGQGVGAGRKSFAMGLILQAGSRTLTDADADRCVNDAVAVLGDRFGARLRG